MEFGKVSFLTNHDTIRALYVCSTIYEIHLLPANGRATFALKKRFVDVAQLSRRLSRACQQSNFVFVPACQSLDFLPLELVGRRRFASSHSLKSMLAGFIVFEVQNGSHKKCRDFEANLSYSATNDSDQCDKYNRRLVFMPLSLLALITNLLAVVIFVQQKRPSALRHNLLMLVSSETALHFFMVATYVNVIVGVCYFNVEDRHVQLGLQSLFFTGADVFIFMRNYCNVLVTLQRCEGVLFPLKRRPICTPRACLTAFLLVLILALSLCVMRAFDSKLLVCKDINYYAAYSTDLLYAQNWYAIFEAFGFYCVQTTAPVGLVVIASLAIALCLLRDRSAIDLRATCSAHAVKVRATKTVLALAVVFTLLETPPMIFTLVQTFVDSVTISSGTQNIMYNVIDLCIALDSLFNIVVFMITMPQFRGQFVGFFSWMSCFSCYSAAAAANEVKLYCRTDEPAPFQARFFKQPPKSKKKSTLTIFNSGPHLITCLF